MKLAPAKHLTAALLALFLAATASRAQTIKIGVRAGSNFATFRGDTQAVFESPTVSGDFGFRTAFQVGGILRFAISDLFVVQSEVLYTQKGTTISGTITNSQGRSVGFSATSRFSYLEIPVLATVVIPTESPLRPSLFAGPALGFNLRAESQAEFRDESGSEGVDVSPRDFSGVIGGGLGYVLQSGNEIVLDVRYEPGFTDTNTDDDVTLQNEVITVGISYLFAL